MTESKHNKSLYHGTDCHSAELTMVTLTMYVSIDAALEENKFTVANCFETLLMFTFILNTLFY